MGHKVGDNAQVLALAEALSWPFDIKRLVYRRTGLYINLFLGGTLTGVNTRASTLLAPPWPDLVISAGRRNEPVAQWIRAQGGNHVKLVHIGRPWASPARFDLIVTTPQYQLEHPNVLHNALPLHRVDERCLAMAGSQWTSHLAHLPRPYVALLVGGSTGNLAFNVQQAAVLGEQANAVAAKLGGSLLVTTSARTSVPAAETLQRMMQRPHFFFHWRPDSTDNPYYAFLALADVFIVTSESMSMLTEACLTRKPVYIFDVAGTHRPFGRVSSGAWLHDAGRRLCYNLRYKKVRRRLIHQFGPRRMRRDMGKIHQYLVESGRAAWLGADLSANLQPPPLEDLDRAVRRVQQLFTPSYT
jgi:mitochondrial fission protein ELM1